MTEDLGEAHARAVEVMAAATGRMIVSGVGKSGHIGNKIAATFASTGTPAKFVHPAEGSYGCLGMITDQDACMVISSSGETQELVGRITYTWRFVIRLIGKPGRPGGKATSNLTSLWSCHKRPRFARLT